MLVKEIIDLYEILDSAYASGAKVAEFLKNIRPDCKVSVETIQGKKGKTTDVVKVLIPGKNGKTKGGTGKRRHRNSCKICTYNQYR